MNIQKILSLSYVIIALSHIACFGMQSKVIAEQTSWLSLVSNTLSYLHQQADEERLKREQRLCEEQILGYIQEKRYNDARSLIRRTALTENIVIEAAKSEDAGFLRFVLEEAFNKTTWKIHALKAAVHHGNIHNIEWICSCLFLENIYEPIYAQAVSCFRECLKCCAERGMVDVLKKLIKGICIACNKTDWKDYVPQHLQGREIPSFNVLRAAIQGKQLDTVLFLLEQGVPYSNGTAQSLEEVIAQIRKLGANKIAYLIRSYHHRNNIPKMIEKLSTYIDPTKSIDLDKKNRQKLIISGRIKLHPSFLNQWRDGNGNTILHKVATEGDVSLFRLIYSFNPVLFEVKNNSDETPLMLAVGYGKFATSNSHFLQAFAAFKKSQISYEVLQNELQKTIVGCIFFLYLQKQQEVEQEISCNKKE